MAGGGAAPAAKSDDPAPHPTKDQLPNVSYCITSPPPWPEAILLGFQHYLVMLGTTVIIPTALVPQMGGGNEEKAKVIQTVLFVSGLNTLLQTSFGTRLPAVIGGSYTFVAPTISIILSGRWEDPDPVSRFKKIMRATQGALIVASTLQIVLGFSGLWRNVVRFLTPLSAVPLVSLVGFGLYEFGFPGVAKCVEVGLPQLVLLVIFSQYLAHLIRPGKHIFDRFAVLFTVAIVWIYAYILTLAGAYNGKPQRTQISCRTDRAGLIGAAPWIRVPYPFQWGAPSFDAGEAFAMMMATFVALVESTGAFIAVARYASATPMPPSILSRGVGWQVNRCFPCKLPSLVPTFSNAMTKKGKRKQFCYFVEFERRIKCIGWFERLMWRVMTLFQSFQISLFHQKISPLVLQISSARTPKFLQLVPQVCHMTLQLNTCLSHDSLHALRE
uniref:Permease I n=1 Tax=Solanum tuberosum TaxID=4113 RepID=M1BPF7_SOLTU